MQAGLVAFSRGQARACRSSYARRMESSEDRSVAFHRLHASGCFVMPNPWDAGSARALEQLGFKALATTSAGFAWTLGRADNQATLNEVLEHLRVIVSAVTVPVNADFEGGFAVEPEHVAANVTLAAGTGIAGLSIEDSTGNDLRPLYDFDLAVERMQAARRAIDESGTDIVLTGRSEGFVCGRPDIDETIRRLRVRGCRSRLPLRSADRHRRARCRHRRRSVAQADKPADQRPVHDGRRGRGAGSTAHQRRWDDGAHRMGGVPRGCQGDRRRRNVLQLRATAERRLAAPGPVGPLAGVHHHLPPTRAARGVVLLHRTDTVDTPGDMPGQAEAISRLWTHPRQALPHLVRIVHSKGTPRAVNFRQRSRGTTHLANTGPHT